MLSISGLNQYYGGSHILRDLSFEVPKGACTTILGRNGVGKTTLLKCLVGVVPTRSGALAFNGKDITVDAAVRARAAGHRLRAAGPRNFSAPDRRRKSADGTRAQGRRAAKSPRAFSTCFRC